MYRMSYNQLKSLPRFKIWNEHGSIEFLPLDGSKGLDLTEVDLAQMITIKQKMVYVYEAEKNKPFISKPNLGEKLNVPAIIYLKNLYKKGETPQ